jgi:uncharacterized repeat protein (TIGR01451 family)
MLSRRTWFGGWFKARRNPAPASRGLGFERLETRRVFALDSLGAIAGTVYNDLGNNGQTADDTPVAGASVKLYRDGGNGAYNSGSGDDTLVSTVSTDASGKYRFDGLSAGRYFVLETPVAGMQTGGGLNPLTVDISAADSAGVVGLVIDSFEGAAQGVEASNSTSTIVTSSQQYAESIVLGGERDLYAELTSANGNVGLFSNQDVPHVLEFTSSSSGRGKRVVTWDGTDGDATTLNPSGLGGKDLTVGGTMSGMRLDIGADHANGSLTIRIYSGAGNYSEAVVVMPETGGAPSQFVYVPFSSFVTKGGSGANFAQVGAIQMDIDGIVAVDGQVESFRLLGPTVKNADFLNVKQIDLMIDKADSPDPVVAGQQLTYTMVVTNNGPANATGVTVTDPLPANVTYVSSATTQGTVTFANGVLTGNIGNLAMGETAMISVIVTANPDFRGTLTNEATVTGNEVEINLSNNKSTVTTNVNGVIDLSVDKSDTPDPVSAGGTLTYTIVVTNNGPSAATGVKFVDTLPAGLTFVSASPGANVTASGNTITGTIGNLGVGQSVTYTIVTTVGPTVSGTITNTVTVTGTETDSNPSNNTDTEPTTIELLLASISGHTYVDANNNGVFDPSELPISGVTVRLTGTALDGSAVDRVLTTDFNGFYLFDNLLPGNYQIHETQPVVYDDGKDTQGNPQLGTVDNDAFLAMLLAAGTDATNYNFGERDRPIIPSDTPNPPLSKFYLLV